SAGSSGWTAAHAAAEGRRSSFRAARRNRSSGVAAMSSAVEFAYPAPSAARSIEDSLAKLSAHGGAGPVDFRGRLSALGELSRMILAPGSGLRDKLPREGLAFLASFLDSDFLLGQIARELKDVDSLSGFVRINARKSLRT